MSEKKHVWTQRRFIGGDPDDYDKYDNVYGCTCEICGFEYSSWYRDGYNPDSVQEPCIRPKYVGVSNFRGAVMLLNEEYQLLTGSKDSYILTTQTPNHE